MDKATVVQLVDHVQYAADAVVSKTLVDQKTGTLTLFAFDAGQGLSEHSAPYDAYVLVLEGEAQMTIGGQDVRARVGDLVLMPQEPGRGQPGNAASDNGNFHECTSCRGCLSSH